MSSGTLSFKRQFRPGDETIGPFDALSLGITMYNVPPPHPPLPASHANPKFIITTPNMTWVPELNFGPQSVRARKDGRYGVHDFTLWPQVHTTEFEYGCVTLRRPEDLDSPVARYWWTPGPDQFIPAAGTVCVGLGTLCPAWRDPFKEDQVRLTKRVAAYQEAHANNPRLNMLENAMRQGLVRLTLCPMTYREFVLAVAEYQRCYLDTLAWIDYQEIYVPRMASKAHTAEFPVNTRLMGAWTHHHTVAHKLWQAGIPVWFVRPDYMIPDSINCANGSIRLTPPDQLGIVFADWDNGDGIHNPFPKIFSGLPGVEVHRLIRLRALVFVDHPDPMGSIPGFSSGTPMKRTSERSMESTQRATQRPQPYPPNPPGKRGKGASTGLPFTDNTRFEDPITENMPPGIPIWQTALRAVVRDAARLVPNHAPVGYPFPDPRLFVGSIHMIDYIAKWLSRRDGWLAAVAKNLVGERVEEGSNTRSSAGIQTVPNQQWRDFLAYAGGRDDMSKLSAGTSKTMKRKTKSLAFFSAAVEDWTVPHQLFWNGRKILAEDVHQLQPRVAAEILWDLFEHNFRFELLLLDRTIMSSDWRAPETAAARDRMVQSVFPGDTGYIVDTIPTQNVGLAAEHWGNRLPYVEAFRKLIISWPAVPSSIRATQLTARTAESEVISTEKAIAFFYCQTFFNHFARAAITPHRLPQS